MKSEPTNENTLLPPPKISASSLRALMTRSRWIEAGRILLSLTADGVILRGLDSTHAAWSAVGKGHRTAFLRWPLIRWFADKIYLWFAANRYKVSYWLTGQARCDSGSCARRD